MIRCLALLALVGLAAATVETHPRPHPPPRPVITHHPKKLCPKGYTANFHDKSCYKFVNKGSTWVEAWHACREDDAFLVSIETPAEQKHLVDHIEANKCLQYPDYPAVYYWGYWTSGNDIKSRDVYKWASTGKPMTYKNFATNQPNDNYWGVGEMCVNLVKKWHWKWNDLICFDNFNGYICEKHFHHH